MQKRAPASSDVLASPQLYPDGGDWEDSEIGLPFPLGRDVSLASSMIDSQCGQSPDGSVMMEQTVDPQLLQISPVSDTLELDALQFKSVKRDIARFADGAREDFYQGIPVSPSSSFEDGEPSFSTFSDIIVQSPSECSFHDAHMPLVAFSHVMDI
ncbi:hypothetical protein VTH82DRAFT_4841 [Thermothelomyces myriococcoides]